MAEEEKIGYNSRLKKSLDQDINDSKTHIWNSFFENIISVSGTQLSYIRPHVSVDIIRVFFNFLIFWQKVSRPTKTSEKVHSFYNTVLLKKPHLFYEPRLTLH